VKLVSAEMTDCFTAFRVSKSLLAQIDKACQELDLTRSQLFRRSVDEYLKAHCRASSRDVAWKKVLARS
jgi:hypothetical protein